MQSAGPERHGSDQPYTAYPTLASATDHASSSSSSSKPHQFTEPRRPSPPQRKSSTKRQAESPPPGADGGSYKVARAISSCVRCRTRKQKCDGKLPACSACERAKVECVGFDAISKQNVSRNYLHSLEQEVQQLRAQVASLTSSSSDTASEATKVIAANAQHAIHGYGMEDDSSRSPWDSPSFANSLPPIQTHSHSHSHSHSRTKNEYPLPQSLSGDPPRSPYSPYHHPTGQPQAVLTNSLTKMVAAAASRTGHATAHHNGMHPFESSSVSGSDKGVDSPATAGPGHSPEVIPTPPSAGSRRAQGARTPVSVSDTKEVKQLSIPVLPPQAAVERLVAAYVDFVGVTAPMIHIPTLGKQINRLREGKDVTETDIFVVTMVLALSTMASSRFVDPPDELRRCSELFHTEALKHINAVFAESSYAGLQAILLLVWYSLLNPDKGSLWFLVGLATRTCVDLGFHNEHNVDVDSLDALELDMRRRLFWVTYKMDRLLSFALGRPPAIPDGFINVPLSSSLHDIDIHPGHYGPLQGEDCSYKLVFLHTTRLRQLQSEIITKTYGVHGTGAEPPSSEWYDNCFERLKNWLATTPEPRGTVSSEGYAISFHNSTLLLFRPSPGCPRPGVRALTTVLASSSYIIRIYRRMQLNNRISWLWLTSHFSFMAGLSYLYAYFNLYSVGGSNCPSMDDALVDIEACLGVLEFLSPRVPSASACHETMTKVSEAIFSQLSKLDPPTAPPASPGRMIRGAPISSSRDDPLPNEAFPAPLPPVTLPYELSLLDNLFLNPMAAHPKASTYTDSKNRPGFRLGPSDLGGTVSGAAASFGVKGHSMGQNKNNNSNSGLGAYGMAAQVDHNLGLSLGPQFPHLGGNLNMHNGGGQNVYDPQLAHLGTGNMTGGAAPAAEPTDLGMAGDLFSFLMDEDGGFGSSNWDSLEIPADFSTIS